MNEERLNGESSLQIIQEMLSATKREEVKGLRAHFLIWGIACIVIGLATYLTTSILQEPLWNLLWFSLFFVPIIPAASHISKPAHSVTFLEESVRKVLNTLGTLFVALTLGFAAASLFTQVLDFRLMLPLAVLFTSFSSMQVWSMVRRRGHVVLSAVLLFLGAVLFAHIFTTNSYSPIHNLVGGALLGANFLIPGLLYRPKGGVK